MGYTKNINIVARRGYSGLGGVIHGGLSGISDFLSNLLSSYNASQQAQGAANQAQADTQRAIAAQSGGIDTTTIVLLGGAGLAAYMLMRKRKPKAA